MPLTTLFANLTVATGPQLDEVLAELGAIGVIPCSVAGSNVITLTPLQPTPDRAAYANYGQWSGIVASTNTGVVTASVGSLPVLVVYKDLGAGPVPCDGGELVAGNAFTLIYDSALGSGVGGFHLMSSTASTGLFLPLTGGVLSGPLLGPTITGTIGGFQTATATIASVQSLTAALLIGTTLASLASLTALNASLATLNSPLGLFTNASISNGTFSTLTAVSLATVAKLQVGASSSSITRILSTLGTVAFSIVPPLTTQDASMLLAGAQVGDSVDLGPPASPVAGAGFMGYIAAAGTVNVRIDNVLVATTLAAATLTIRATAMGFT